MKTPKTKPKTDLNNKSYALLSQTKPGDILIADGGFISDANGLEIFCINPWTKNKVISHPDGLAVKCAHGLHFLDGCLDFEDNDSLIGFYPSPAK